MKLIKLIIAVLVTCVVIALANNQFPGAIENIIGIGINKAEDVGEKILKYGHGERTMEVNGEIYYWIEGEWVHEDSVEFVNESVEGY